jgi:hypothetical protein
MEIMQRVNKMPFGDDTRASFAVYFQSQMVNVDAIEKPAQLPALPDAITDDSESPEYRTGWNECREVMKGMMK